MNPEDCTDAQCCCKIDWHEATKNSIELDYDEILKYKEKYGSWYLAQSRTILEHYKRDGNKEEIKRRKMIWRHDKRVDRQIRRKAFFRGFKRGFTIVFTGGRPDD